MIFPDAAKVVYRRPPNIREKLVHAKLRTNPALKPPRRANHARSRIGKYAAKCVPPTSSPVAFRHKIKGDADCDSENVVHLIECSACIEQYIGQTMTAFHLIFNNHEADVKTKPNLPVCRNLNQPEHLFTNVSVAKGRAVFLPIRIDIRECFLMDLFPITSVV